MKLILTIYFYVATLMLPSIVSTLVAIFSVENINCWPHSIYKHPQIYGRTLMQYSNDVDAIAAAGGVINGIFEPLAGGHLGMGSFAFVYLGSNLFCFFFLLSSKFQNYNSSTFLSHTQAYCVQSNNRRSL